MPGVRPTVLFLVCLLWTASLAAGAVGLVPDRSSATPMPSQGASNARPNVVLITADDMRADDLAFMPRTRALFGRAGVRFREAVAPYPLCCPARASLLTGQYSHNHRVLGNEWPRGGHRVFYESGREKDTLPVWLRRAGYGTAFIGKYLNYYGSTSADQGSTGPRHVPPGWDDWNASVGGVFRYYCPTLNQNGRLRTFPGHYQTDLYTDLAERNVERFTAAGKPFFLWVSQLAPHLGVHPGERPCQAGSGPTPTPAAQRHAGMFEGMPLPHSPARNEADMSDKGSYMRDRALLDPSELDRVDRVHQGRLESLQALDESVARTFQALRAADVLDETVVIFTSDNGWLLGEHRARKKILPYDESLAVPLLVRGPGFPKGAVRRQVVGTPDVTATVVEATGATVPSRTPVDGVPLQAVAADPAYLRHRVLPIEAGPMPGLQRRAGTALPEWLYRGVRSASHTYVRWHLAGGTHEEEFYDLVADPYELESRHRVPSASLDAMRAAYADLADCIGAECVREYPAATSRSAPPPPRDAIAPRLRERRAPSGWIRSLTPTIGYLPQDGTDAADDLRLWCSPQATRCGRTGARFRLGGEGRHPWTVFATDPGGNVASVFGEFRVDRRAPRASLSEARYAVAVGAPSLGWRLTDSASGVVSVDTRLRRTGLTGPWGNWRYPKRLQDRRNPPTTVATPSRHGTVCVQVRARDRVGRVSTWSRASCRARAVDAADLPRTGRWRTAARPRGWLGGTAQVTRDRGAAVSLPARRGIALVSLAARIGPGQGRVRVSMGDTVLARLNLQRARSSVREFTVPVPRGVTGKLTVRVTTDARPVWLDWLGVVRR